MSTLKLHSGTRKMLWGQPGLFSLTSNQNSWSNPSFAFCSPAQGYHCREMVISEESVCPGHPSAAVIRQCKSQSKVQLTHSELCWLSRTKRQNNKKNKETFISSRSSSSSNQPTWRAVLASMEVRSHSLFLCKIITQNLALRSSAPFQ